MTSTWITSRRFRLAHEALHLCGISLAPCCEQDRLRATFRSYVCELLPLHWHARKTRRPDMHRLRRRRGKQRRQLWLMKSIPGIPSIGASQAFILSILIKLRSMFEPTYGVIMVRINVWLVVSTSPIFDSMSAME